MTTHGAVYYEGGLIEQSSTSKKSIFQWNMFFHAHVPPIHFLGETLFLQDKGQP